MARIEASTHIEAPIERVWSELVDWEGQARWMQDAQRVTVMSAQRAGTGVVIRAKTGLLGLTIDDDMQVTEWQEPRRLGVRHLGRVISGVGAFELTPTAPGTQVLWWEEVAPPLGRIGELGASLLVVPIVRRVFRDSLAALKRVCESTSVRP